MWKEMKNTMEKMEAGEDISIPLDTVNFPADMLLRLPEEKLSVLGPLA